MLLGTRKGLFKGALPPRVLLCQERSDVEFAGTFPRKRVTWVSFTRSATDMLLEEAVKRRVDVRGAHLITLTPPRAESVPALLGLFHPVIGLVEGFRWLPKLELIEAIASDDANTRFIAGSVDRKARRLTLLRGDLQAVVAPFSLFSQSGDGPAPDFGRLRLTDHGRTVSLGDYEASADAVLYELDPAHRRRLKSLRRDSEQSLGAALLRLRKQRGLRQGDFAPISAKEIARIERNLITQPHTRTLEVIASRLQVRPDEIADY